MTQVSNTIQIMSLRGHTALAGFIVNVADTELKVKVKEHDRCVGEACACAKQVFLWNGKHVALIAVPFSSPETFEVVAVETDKCFKDPSL